MASAFAAQLRAIAQNSTHELDLRARRSAHAESLLFSKEVASKQDFDTIYATCIGGFQELCSLDAAFVEFERNLFSTQSVQTEREQMNKSENQALDQVLERCLAMLGGRVLLKPGLKCLEWLVRRFRVHVNNTASLLLAVLPWHEMGVWRNVLSIIPKEKCVGEWKFLGIYKGDALNVPRTAIVSAMANNNGFFSAMNKYVIDSALAGISHTGLLKFWTSISIEAVIMRLDTARSGRKEIQKQRTDDLLLKVLPVLSDGLEVRDCPDLTTACFTLAMVLAGRADLDDRVLDSILQAVTIALQFSDTDRKIGVVTMTVVVGQKQQKRMPRASVEAFLKIPDLERTLEQLREAYDISILVESLVSGALSGLKTKNIVSRTKFLGKLLRFANQQDRKLAIHVTKSVIQRISTLKANKGVTSEALTSLIELLQHLGEDLNFSVTIAEASKELKQDPAQLEAFLGSTIATVDVGADIDPDTSAMEIDLPPSTTVKTEELLEKVPPRTVETNSFLAKHDCHLYEQLAECFSICCKSARYLQSFTSLPIWKSSQPNGLLFSSLLLRIATGKFPSSQRSVALQLLAELISQMHERVDAQIFLPYVLTALLDSAQNVRRSAADLVIIIEKLAPVEANPVKAFGVNQLYRTSNAENGNIFATSHLREIISVVLLPVLEECVLDATQIARTIQFALIGSDTGETPAKSSQTELKKNVRHDLLRLLTSNAVATPVMRVKISIIQLLRQVHKVGISTTSKTLAPLLDAWASLDEVEAQRVADAEGLTLLEIDTAMVSIMSPRDKEVVGRILGMLEDREKVLRVDLATAYFEHLQNIWKELKHEVKVINAQKLFDLAFQDSSGLAKSSQGVLRSVHLTTDILGFILEHSTSGIGQMQNEEQQPKKKRRTSHGRDSLPPDVAGVVKASSSRLTFALELVDDSSPETRPELLPVLFDILSTLKGLKHQLGLNLPYLQNLCLNHILAIVEIQRRLSKPTIDVSSIRIDLVTDCIRSSDNPSVQTSALQLSSSLAAVAPDRVLHNVMPIFTFMGQSMFQNDDERSIYTVNQAIDTIIPALVQSLQKQKRNLIKSASSLLASFTAAFDHIPQHRRVATYARLISQMGAQQFAYIVFAMLAQRKAHQSSFDTFLAELLARLDAETQLVTVGKTITLGNNLLDSDPQLAEDILGPLKKVNAEDRQTLSKTMFGTALRVLQSESLKDQLNGLHKLDTDTAGRLRDEMHSSFRLILYSIHDHRRRKNDVVEEAKKCLDALLTLVPLRDLFTIIPDTLASEEIDNDLKPQALRVLASQLGRNPPKDGKTRVGAMDLLAKLTETLQSDINVAVKQAIIICIDRLSEVYGRKDIDAVIAAANVVTGEKCLGSGDRRLEVMSSLCLASMLEVLKEGCAPIVPEMMSKVIDLMRIATDHDVVEEELYNGLFSLMIAIVSHVPFLISDLDLQSLLLLSSLSATKYASSSAIESRTEALSVIARKIDLGTLLTAMLIEDLDAAREHPENAELEKLDMLSAALKAAPNASVVRHADTISQLLLAHLDQRSRLLSAVGAVDDDIIQAVVGVEAKVNDLSIQFIYKLNNTAFRPIFESWIEWATNAYDIEDVSRREKTKSFRQTSIFQLLAHFFDTLKSIVTSYASYVIPMSHVALASTASVAESKKAEQVSIDPTSYTSLLNMLRSMFAHDADGFYNVPSHFEPIAAPLVSQLKFASSKVVRTLVYSHVVPTIVSFANATFETPSHHQKISHELVQLRHSSSAGVRLASIKAFAAISADETVGDEFIANVIGIGSGEGEGARGIGGGGSVGEIMIYVNEMLEDDDEDVEREVRQWVQAVREKAGEDIFEV